MKLVAGKTVGIDLGTVNSAVAQLDKRGNPIILRNAADDSVTPSMIVLKDSSTALVAPNGSLEDYSPQQIITGVKRHVGQNDFQVMHSDRELNAEILSAMILRKLKKDAEQRIGPIGNAVITVPYYFNDVCRRSTFQSGLLADLNVIDIINEPTAATLAHAWINGELGRLESREKSKTLLVYDLGGGTFDVTLVKYSSTEFRVIATDGDVRLGGIDWTERLAQHVAIAFKAKHGFSPMDDAAHKLELMKICEEAKQQYTSTAEAVIPLEFADCHLTVRVPRRTFLDLTSDLLFRTQDTTEQVLKIANIQPKELDELLMVGGSTYLPEVSEMLEKLTNRKAKRLLNPQLAVAQGAAIHAAILEAKATNGKSRIGRAVVERLQSITSVDINPHSLGVVVNDAKNPHVIYNHVMIPRNSPLPAIVKQRFVTTLNNPEGIRIKLLEGESRTPSACIFIGSVRITGLPQDLPAGSPVEVEYGYDEHRRICVTARELTSHKEATAQIVWEGAQINDSLAPLRALENLYRVM